LSRSLRWHDEGVAGVEVGHGRAAGHVRLVAVLVRHRHQLVGSTDLSLSLQNEDNVLTG
jgi:hypothetical protein